MRRSGGVHGMQVLTRRVFRSTSAEHLVPACLFVLSPARTVNSNLMSLESAGSSPLKRPALDRGQIWIR
jgi:hypothetical protein